MGDINPAAVLVIALCTVIGAIFGAWLIGLACGLAVVVIGTIQQH